VTADPYTALVTIAEREYALVSDGRIDELEALIAERAALIASLPAQAPASARAALERAASLQNATSAALRAALDEARRSMGSMDQRHRAARVYAQFA
jgi:hypothetical protein